MKTPEEIKKGLELCSIGEMRECMQCPYPIGFECFEQPMKDALDYIQQLESRLDQVERERDAAVRDLKLSTAIEYETQSCHFCKYANRQCLRCKWQWRGVCPENSKEGTNEL